MYYILVAIFLTTSVFADEQDKAAKLQEFIDQGLWLPFQPAVPDDFVMKPMTPDGQLGLAEGTIWSTKNTIEDVWQQYKKDPGADFNNKTGIIRVRMSNNVFQAQPGIMEIKEEDFQNQLKKMGAKEVTYRNVKWGEYPLTIAEVTFSKRKPMALAWMGLNAGGVVILIDYVFPDGQTSYDKDWEIWKKFICETKGVSLEEIQKKIEDFEKVFQ